MRICTYIPTTIYSQVGHNICHVTVSHAAGAIIICTHGIPFIWEMFKYTCTVDSHVHCAGAILPIERVSFGRWGLLNADSRANPWTIMKMVSIQKAAFFPWRNARHDLREDARQTFYIRRNERMPTLYKFLRIIATFQLFGERRLHKAAKSAAALSARTVV